MSRLTILAAVACVVFAANVSNAAVVLRINGTTSPTINLGANGTTTLVTVSLLGTVDGNFPDNGGAPFLATYNFGLRITNAAAAQVSAITNLAGGTFSSGGVGTNQGTATASLTPPVDTSAGLNLVRFTITSLNSGSSDLQTTVRLVDLNTGNNLAAGAAPADTPVGDFMMNNGIATPSLNRDHQLFTAAGGFSSTQATLNVSGVPEPSSMALLGVAGALAGWRARRKLRAA